MSDDDGDSDKSFEPTPERLKKAREDGDVPKSQALLVAASYLGVLLAFYSVGKESIETLGTALTAFLDQPDRLATVIFGDALAAPVTGPLITRISFAVLPWYFVPAVVVILAVLAQKAFVIAPKRIEPKLSRLSIIKNAKNKFGRAGFFEFGKNVLKLLIYAVALSLYLKKRLPELLAAVGGDAVTIVPFIAQLSLEFLFIALIVSAAIGVVDASFQQAEFIRKNMMSRKDIQDEMKNSEGDPHMKQQRKQKGQAMVQKQIKSAVAGADVVIVNPTHYAVVLEWDRALGGAPICGAKGVDEVAAVIREVAQEHGVPIHSDPPTARALYATMDVGDEVEETHYAPVAAAIRFAEEMRERVKGRF